MRERVSSNVIHKRMQVNTSLKIENKKWKRAEQSNKPRIQIVSTQKVQNRYKNNQ